MRRHRVHCDVTVMYSSRYSPQLLLKIKVIDLDLQGHSAISTKDMAFNVALVYRSRSRGVTRPKHALMSLT